MTSTNDTEAHHGPSHDRLRKAISDSGKSLYRIAKGSGVPHSSLHRFTRHEGTITLASFEKVCEYLGLRLTKG